MIKRAGLTLIELLVVLAIIGVLAALLFPVFAGARQRAQQATCASNLRQIGIATIVYAQDNDDGFPYGGDPYDLFSGDPLDLEAELAAKGLSLRPVQQVLAAYTVDPRIWHCPSDTGWVGFGPENVGYPLPPTKSCFATYDTSYAYDTPLIDRSATISRVPNPSQTSLFFDEDGTWHEVGDAPAYEDARVNIVYVDGHVAPKAGEDALETIY